MGDGEELSGRAAKLVEQVTKAAGDALPATEAVQIAVRVNLKGTVAATAAGAIGGAVGAMVAAKASSAGADDATAAGFPTNAQQALGLTATSLVVTSRSSLSGKPKAHLATVALSSIAGVEHEAGRLGDTLTFTMADGSTVRFECVKVDPGAEFAAALRDRLGAGS